MFNTEVLISAISFIMTSVYLKESRVLLECSLCTDALLLDKGHIALLSE